MLYILIAILLFGLLIAVHEFGHFFTAKLAGVRVNEFALGMGPLLLSRQKGETLYSLRALPIGGFCAMEGEDGDSDDPRSFTGKSPWVRLVILVAGAGMNFLTGLVMILIVFSLAGVPASARITGFMPGAEALTRQGILPGDLITKVDGHRIWFRSDAQLYLSRGEDTVELQVLREGKKLELGPVYLPLVYPQQSGGQIVYKRGIVMDESPAAGLGDTLKNTWFQAVDDVRLVWMGLCELLTGQAGLEDMGGPILIVQLVGEAGEQGAQAAAAVGRSPALWAAVNILSLGSFVAINLAVMNLLPIPALDGGRVFFLAVNGVYTLLTRKKLDPKYEAWINAAGLVCLLGLMAVVAVNDVMKVLS